MAKVMTKVPDGKGGWREEEGEATEGRAVNGERQEAALRQQFYREAGALTETFWKVGRLGKQEANLTDEQVAFAVALLCVNVRETFPNGKERFDAIAAEAAAYYDEAAAHG